MAMANAEQKRLGRQRKAQQQGRTVRPYVKSSDGVPQSRAQLKRRYKANKAAREGRVRDPRRCVETRFHDAHVKAFYGHMTALWHEINGLHDAHARRFRSVMCVRNRQASRYSKNPDSTKARAAKRRESLNDSYVIQNLVAMGFRREGIEDFVIGMKREQMSLRRLSSEVRQAVKQFKQTEPKESKS